MNLKDKLDKLQQNITAAALQTDWNDRSALTENLEQFEQIEDTVTESIIKAHAHAATDPAVAAEIIKLGETYLAHQIMGMHQSGDVAAANLLAEFMLKSAQHAADLPPSTLKI